MAKTPKPLMAPLELRVLIDDAEADYRTTPVDVWRAEKLTGIMGPDLLHAFTGYAALAYSCALRAGHTIRQKGQDDRAAFQAWLELAGDVLLLTDDDQEVPAEIPLDPTSSDG